MPTPQARAASKGVRAGAGSITEQGLKSKPYSPAVPAVVAIGLHHAGPTMPLTSNVPRLHIEFMGSASTP